MGELSNSQPLESSEPARRTFLRRLMALVAAGGAAFGLTAWTLVRFNNRFDPLAVGGEPAGVVKAQLEALNRGELRTAYALFSPRYRGQVSFEEYHALVAAHRRVFHTRAARFSRQEESGQRAMLETHLLAEGGARYVARFTLVRAEGRWWIDDLHWRAERPDRNMIAA